MKHQKTKTLSERLRVVEIKGKARLLVVELSATDATANIEAYRVAAEYIAQFPAVAGPIFLYDWKGLSDVRLPALIKENCGLSVL